ncbi:site-specific integrase, partial [Streptomyces sp. URMC 125]
MSPKPTTYARYRDYVRNDLLPHLGRVRLDDLGYGHIAAFARDQSARGRVTVHRCLATLSSALAAARRRRRAAAGRPPLPR